MGINNNIVKINLKWKLYFIGANPSCVEHRCSDKSISSFIKQNMGLSDFMMAQLPDIHSEIDDVLVMMKRRNAQENCLLG